MSFEDMLLRAKLGDEIARGWLLEKYKPLVSAFPRDLDM